MARRDPRRSAALVLALYVSGVLALLFHLATEQHFVPTSESARRPSLRDACPCRQHTPHAAGDHEANQTSTADEPRAASFEETLAPAAFAAALPAAESAPLALVLEPAPSRVPIVWEQHPPRWDACRPCEQPRAPPSA